MSDARLQLTTGEVLPLTVATYDEGRKLPPEQTLRSVCFAPFSNMDFDATGTIRVCNHSWQFIGHVGSGIPLLDIWRGEAFTQLRRNFENYTLDAQNCLHCIAQCQSSKHAPVQVFATQQFDQFATNSDQPAYPSRLIFRLGNNCNMACVMCDGETSSRIRKDRDQLPPVVSPYGEAFFEQMREILPYIQYAEFYGGEPFLVPGHRRIFKMLQELNRDCRVYVNTNNMVLNHEVEDLYRTLNFTHVVVSMDAVGDHTHALVRKGLHQKQFLANWQRLLDIQKHRKYELLINLTEHRKNWYAIPSVFNFAASHGVYLHLNVCLHPQNVTLYTLPTDELRYVLNYLQRHQPQYGPYDRNRHSFEALQNLIMTEISRRDNNYQPPVLTRVNQESDGLLATPWPGEPPCETPEDVIREVPFMRQLLPEATWRRVVDELLHRIYLLPDTESWNRAKSACQDLLLGIYMPTLELVVGQDGSTRHLLDEPNAELYKPFGPVVEIYRNSHVESTGSLGELACTIASIAGNHLPSLLDKWWADMTPLPDGTVLGPFETHAEAIAAEVEWLRMRNLPEPRK